MAYCRSCGSVLQEGEKFCPECGSAVPGVTPVPDFSRQDQRKRRKKKGLFRRLWFWVLAAVIAVTVCHRQDTVKTPSLVRGPYGAAASSTPAQRTSALGADAVPAAVPTPEPAPSAVSESGIRPEVREFLAAYEACMDEYVAFMRKYTAADPASILILMGDYTRIVSRFSEYEEKMESFDERDLNTAEFAFFLEVTNRVNQKLLSVSGG